MVGAARNFRGDGWQAALTLERPGEGAPARHIGYLDFADMGQRAAAKVDQVPLADLRVIEIEIELEVRTFHRLDQRGNNFMGCPDPETRRCQW